MRARIISILVAVAIQPTATPAQTRGITPEDYFSFELLSDPRISPDGSRVAYVVSRVDRTSNRRVPSIWMAPTDGSAPAKVLIGESWSPSSPRWSADGATIEFISARAATPSGAPVNGTPTTPIRPQ
ncbi:MAG TPA: hypothetical protein VKP00_12220, partial [Gemmatimonadaceae bacterium]|nr:hypothetical protein [Gemmatimonadaceae bacterium]